MPFSDFESVLPALDKAGYYSLECWGGATFDSCLRYLNEDPWERLKKIRNACPNTKLQMLLRGQNLLGYRHYPDDIVRMFVKKSVANGIDIIRVFDALNDIRNIETAVDETIKNGASASGALCYTISPIHNLESYVKVAKQMQEMGVSTICVKDMAGILSPKAAAELVKALKESVRLPIIVHTHSTTGLGFMALMSAVEAGVDVIDTAISAYSGGTSQPATETLAYALSELGYDTGLDSSALDRIGDFFKNIRARDFESGLLNPTVLMTDAKALVYQIPGGMLSNLVAQLSSVGRMDLYEDVLRETPIVREELGFPPLVTPMSQMVGAQAVSNVLTGKRYSSVSNEIKSYLKGEYGTPPGEIDEKLRSQILGEEPSASGRFADSLKPAYEKFKNELGDRAQKEEDVLSYALFPEQALKYFDYRDKSRKLRFAYSFSPAEKGRSCKL